MHPYTRFTGMVKVCGYRQKRRCLKMLLELTSTVPSSTSQLSQALGKTALVWDEQRVWDPDREVWLGDCRWQHWFARIAWYMLIPIPSDTNRTVTKQLRPSPMFHLGMREPQPRVLMWIKFVVGPCDVLLGCTLNDVKSYNENVCKVYTCPCSCPFAIRECMIFEVGLKRMTFTLSPYLRFNTLHQLGLFPVSAVQGPGASTWKAKKVWSTCGWKRIPGLWPFGSELLSTVIWDRKRYFTIGCL